MLSHGELIELQKYIKEEKLIELQEKIKEKNETIENEALQTFQSNIEPVIRQIIESSALVYNSKMFSKLNKIMTNTALPCLDSWKASKKVSFKEKEFKKFCVDFQIIKKIPDALIEKKGDKVYVSLDKISYHEQRHLGRTFDKLIKHNHKDYLPFEKYFELYTLSGNDGIIFLQEIIVKGNEAIDQFKINVKPLDKDIPKYPLTESEKDCEKQLNEWKGRVLIKFKEWQYKKIDINDHINATFLLDQAKLCTLHKTIMAREQAAHIFSKCIKPTITGLITSFIKEKKLSPRERNYGIEAATAQAFKILNKNSYNPQKALFKTYLNNWKTKKQILEAVVKYICPEEKKQKDNNERNFSLDANHENKKGTWTGHNNIPDKKTETPDEILLINELKHELVEQITKRFHTFGTDTQMAIKNKFIMETRKSTYIEIATQMGKERRTIKNWIVSGLKELRKEIENFFDQKELEDIDPAIKEKVIFEVLSKFRNTNL